MQRTWLPGALPPEWGWASNSFLEFPRENIQLLERRPVGTKMNEKTKSIQQNLNVRKFMRARIGDALT